MTKQETILIADDAEINRAVLRNLFEKNYNILEAENGEQALVLIRQYSETIAAVLLDLVMPEKDGYEVLKAMHISDHLCHVPVIVITADDSVDSKVKVFELGASDIVTKPFDVDIVKSRVKNIIELGRYRRRLESLVAEQSVRAQETSAAVIDMLSSVIEHRSVESGQHIRRIRMFTKILLEDVAANYQEYNLDERKIRLITDASSMHDIGKIAIPDSILNKAGALTEEEFEIMKTHTTRGCEILAGLDRLQDREYLRYAYNICRYHHERWDGSGYPDGLRENSIPICAQVAAVADCYDALTTDRVYKKAIPPLQAYRMILNGECGAFSPGLLECFKNVRDSFAKCARDYADGNQAPVIEPSEHPALSGPAWVSRVNTLELSQQKYFTLLWYMNSTVMEVDLDTGIYHLVYLADQSFAALRTGNDFEESVRAFADTAVHPEDREEMLKITSEYLSELFDEGLVQRERKYRVLDRGTGLYFWCYASALRIRSEDPRSRRAMLLWHRDASEDLTGARILQGGRNSMGYNEVINQLLGGIQKCRNDNHFTILQFNYGLMDLLGYTEREINEQFQNHYMELIYPADRERIAGEIREQRNSSNIVEIEYRLMAKDGRIVWVSDRFLAAEEGGEAVLYCVILDITRSHKAEEELRLSLERHDIILNQTNDIIFEWDIRKDELYFSANWEDKYGYLPITKQVREAIPRASHIHPDDMPAFVGLMDAVSAGVPYKEIEFRIADVEGRYRWRRVRATTQFDTDGRPFKAVGVIVDIDAQKQASAELEERASRDVLTKLYNKASARERIKKILEESAQEELAALMVLDIDDFKKINDRYGHMFGDAVLVELSASIAGMFRGADILSRIGGDEFMIFMPDIQKKEVAEHRAEALIRTLQKLLRENAGDMSFSCSIGLAFTENRKVGFQELFNQADRALYRAKEAGKNQYVCYSNQMETGCIGRLSEEVNVRCTEAESGQMEQRILSNLISKSFEILYNATDFPQAVQSILALVGETMGISRAYIFENEEGGEVTSNTFEWCSEGIEPQKERLQVYPYVIDGRDYRDNFNEDGIFYCQDVDKLTGWERELFREQGILSSLQCAIQSGGHFLGFAGIDDCSVKRMWTREQINALVFEGKLLAVFLLKNRAQEELSESLAVCRDINACKQEPREAGYGYPRYR